MVVVSMQLRVFVAAMFFCWSTVSFRVRTPKDQMVTGTEKQTIVLVRKKNFVANVDPRVGACPSSCNDFERMMASSTTWLESTGLSRLTVEATCVTFCLEDRAVEVLIWRR